MPEAENPDHAGTRRADKVLPWLLGGGLVALAAWLWIGNGSRLFIEALGAAWAYCF
jgi:hypothetical protein